MSHATQKSAFEGKTIVIGNLIYMKKSEAKKVLTELGAKVTGGRAYRTERRGG